LRGLRSFRPLPSRARKITGAVCFRPLPGIGVMPTVVLVTGSIAAKMSFRPLAGIEVMPTSSGRLYGTPWPGMGVRPLTGIEVMVTTNGWGNFFDFLHGFPTPYGD